MGAAWHVVLPILFLDFLVVALPRSVTPRMMDARYGVAAYTYLGYADAVRGTLAFGSAPLLGALSDRWGRRGPFLACVVGTASPSVVLALSHSLDAYLVAIALSGALSATLPLTFALIADEVPPARRSEAFGLALGCGLGAAFLLGAPAGALLAKMRSAEFVLDVCVGLTLLNALIAVVGFRDGRLARKPRPNVGNGLRSSSAQEQRDLCGGGARASDLETELPRTSSSDGGESEEALLGPLPANSAGFDPFSAIALLRQSWALQLIALSTGFYYCAVWGFVAHGTLYARRRFNFGEAETAALLAIFGFTSLFSQTVGMRMLRERGFSEGAQARLSFSLGAAGLACAGLSSTGWILFATQVLISLSIVGFAALSSLASQVVPPSTVGEAQGVVTSMKALTEGIGPLTAAFLLHRFEASPFPGAAWIVAATFIMVAGALTYPIELAVAAHAARHSLSAKSTCSGGKPVSVLVECAEGGLANAARCCKQRALGTTSHEARGDGDVVERTPCLHSSREIGQPTI